MTIEAVNRALFHALNAPGDLSGVPLALAVTAANYAVVALAALLAYRWIRGSARERSLLTHILLAVLPALAMNYVLGLAFPHPRPFMIGLGHTFMLALLVLPGFATAGDTVPTPPCGRAVWPVFSAPQAPPAIATWSAVDLAQIDWSSPRKSGSSWAVPKQDESWHTGGSQAHRRSRHRQNHCRVRRAIPRRDRRQGR